MILDGLHRIDDPGLPYPERLAAGNAIDVATRRRNPAPERVMRWCWRCFWLALGVAVLLRIVAG